MMFWFWRRKKYKYLSYGETHQGKVRDHNEDAFLDKNEQGLWVIADGAGGHDAGEVASQMLVDALKKTEISVKLDTAMEDIQRCIEAVNKELIRLSGGVDSKRMIASTLCILLVRQQSCVCFWSGDSRIYRLRDQALQLLTRDHNRVDEFIDAGFSPAAAEKHPMAQQLVNAIGVKEPLYLENKQYDLQENDRFLLCSDGLYKELSEQDMLSIISNQTVDKGVRALMAKTMQRGARDNVSSLLVHISRMQQ
ncbi:MAG: PP2C family protein-serine/threonine phosphatase [bacterium]